MTDLLSQLFTLNSSLFTSVNLLSQLPDPGSFQSIGWVVVIVGVLLTGGYYGVALVETLQRIRRGRAARDVNVVNETQRREVALLPTVMTKAMCDERHAALALGNENLIRLRMLEQISAYEAQAKQAREKLHNHIGDLGKKLERMDARLDGLEAWARSTSEKVDEISNGLSNLAGAQGKG